MLLLRGNAIGRGPLGFEMGAVGCGVGGDSVSIAGIVVCVCGTGGFVFVG